MVVLLSQLDLRSGSRRLHTPGVKEKVTTDSEVNLDSESAAVCR